MYPLGYKYPCLESNDQWRTLLVLIAYLVQRETCRVYMWTWFERWCMTFVICHPYLINAIKIIKIVHLNEDANSSASNSVGLVLAATLASQGWFSSVGAIQRDWQLYCFGPSLFQSLSHPVTDWPPFIYWLPLQCHGWFSFLKPVWACMHACVRAERDERKYKGDINREMQPGWCMKTESRQGGRREHRNCVKDEEHSRG